MTIIKFGGNCLNSSENIKKVKKVLAKHSQPFVVVVSAFEGVTNALQNLLDSAINGDYEEQIENLRVLHINQTKELINVSDQSNVLIFVQQKFMQLQRFMDGIYAVSEKSDKVQAKVLALGEELATEIVFRYLVQEGIDVNLLDAKESIVTENGVLDTEVDLAKTQKKLSGIDFSKNHIIAGFISKNAQGEIAVLGRGGADYTASSLGYVLDAKRIELWSDQPGMRNASPKMVENPLQITEMSYEEAFEMAYFGNNIIFPLAINTAMLKDIPVLLKNLNTPEQIATEIKKTPSDRPSSILGITTLNGISLLNISGNGLVRNVGTARKVFEAMDNAEVNIILIVQSSSEQNICFAVKTEQAEKAKIALEESFMAQIKAGIVNPIEQKDHRSILAVIGDQMKSQIGLSGKLFNTLGENDINVEVISQGASERNLSVIIKTEDEKPAVRALYSAFFEK